MVRMTIRHSDDGTTLLIEGALRGTAVHHLRHLWERIVAARLDADLRIDGTRIASLDREGERLLERMADAGVQPIGEPRH